MEIICDLDEIEEDKKYLKNTEKEFEKISEKSLVPRSGFFLGLDISEQSSGICLYENGEKVSANISLETKNVRFEEVLLRRELKGYLTELVQGKEFDLIIIEDAFQGVNPTVTRKLYALNTAIDELILDNVCSCKDFRRVNNQQWKSWLYTIDTEGLYKGLDDKLRIQKCLELLDVYEDGSEGYQDRLDSCGLILGYMLCKSKADTYEERKRKKKVEFSDIEFSYQEEIEFCLDDAGYGVRDLCKSFIELKSASKEFVIDCLTDNPEVVFITSNRLYLGLFGGTIGATRLEDGGHLAFWVSPNKIKKYKKDVEE